MNRPNTRPWLLSRWKLSSAKLKADEHRFNKAQSDEARQFTETQRAEDRRFEEAQRKLYREDEPHIELKLDCKFHELKGDKHLATFTVSAANVRRVEHKFTEILLRIRRIKDEPFEYDIQNDPHPDERARRAAFPHELLKRNLVPRTKRTKWNYILIEPGVKQDISFTTLVPSDYSYLSAHVKFDYEEYRPHTAEAVFAVPQQGAFSA